MHSAFPAHLQRLPLRTIVAFAARISSSEPSYTEDSAARSTSACTILLTISRRLFRGHSATTLRFACHRASGLGMKPIRYFFASATRMKFRDSVSGWQSYLGEDREQDWRGDWRGKLACGFPADIVLGTKPAVPA